MFNRFLDVLFAALLIAFFLPSLAWHAALVGAGFFRRRSTRDANSPANLSGIGLLKSQGTGEFNFEHAVEAYEDLIDSTFAGGRL